MIVFNQIAVLDHWTPTDIILEEEERLLRKTKYQLTLSCVHLDTNGDCDFHWNYPDAETAIQGFQDLSELVRDGKKDD